MQRLSLFQRELPPDVMGQVARQAFDRLAQGPDGAFNVSSLARNWGQLSPQGRAALFGDRVPMVEAAIQRVVRADERAGQVGQIGDAAVRSATGAAEKRLAAANRESLSLLGKSDEQIAGTLAAWAQNKGDLGSLAHMSNMLGPDAMKNLGGAMLQRMWQNNKGDFSAPYLVSR